MTVEWIIEQTLVALDGLARRGTVVDLAVSSPPFLSLRDYGGLEGQHGQEPTPAAWLATQLDVIEACGRILSPTGSIAWEVGDTYAGSGGGGGDYLPGGARHGQPIFTGSGAKARTTATGFTVRDDHPRSARSNRGDGWPPPKSLCGTPQALMLSLAYGRNILALPCAEEWREFAPWRVRNLVAWVRTNPPVGALGDKWRPATSFITIATRSAARWWDDVATRVDACTKPGVRRVGTASASKGVSGGDNTGATGAPLRDWWEVNNPGTDAAHFAVWPPEVVRRLILAMCPAKGVVLDPYAGSGTTLAVAEHLGRDAIGVDLNPANRDEVWPRRRPEVLRQLGLDVATQIPGQMELFG